MDRRPVRLHISLGGSTFFVFTFTVFQCEILSLQIKDFNSFVAFLHGLLLMLLVPSLVHVEQWFLSGNVGAVGLALRLALAVSVVISSVMTLKHTR